MDKDKPFYLMIFIKIALSVVTQGKLSVLKFNNFYHYLGISNFTWRLSVLSKKKGERGGGGGVECIYSTEIGYYQVYYLCPIQMSFVLITYAFLYEC